MSENTVFILIFVILIIALVICPNRKGRDRKGRD